MKIIYKKPRARKLGLGSNFTRIILYGRVTSMGVGIFLPKTEIATLTMKFFLSQKNPILKRENIKNTAKHPKQTNVVRGCR